MKRCGVTIEDLMIGRLPGAKPTAAEAERDALRAFVRELADEGGPLHVVWMGAASGFARTQLSSSDWRQRALALLGDQDGERARVEGGGK